MWKKLLKVLLILLFLMLILVLSAGIAFFCYVERNVETSIDASIFSMVGSDSASKFYYYTEDERGRSVAVEVSGEDLYGEYRSIYVDYSGIPEDMLHAFVSIEDKRFYSHKGVDWRRTVSAGLNYIFGFRDSYGGSTITQQLIKNVTDRDDYSFERKLQEIFWALDLETKMNKEEILGLYLNIINLSQGCYGIGAAADYYFSKDVSELTLNECACIAAITNNPSYYDPVRNPENNTKRRLLILKEMYHQGYITQSEYEKCASEEIVLNLKDGGEKQKIRSWYTDMVIEDVISDLTEQKGYSRSMASLIIYTGGLQIYTAMDPKVQSIMEEYYADPSNFFEGGGEVTPQSSMIVIDPNNGDILGVVGAIGEKTGNRLQNFATQTVRPAGSVIKPLSVYAPALDSDLINWASVYDDVPVSFSQQSNGDYTAWPKNSDGEYRGLINVNTALEKSINTVPIRILEELGVENSFNFLYNKLKIQSLILQGTDKNGNRITDCDLAALALGQMNYGVSVREITAAYSIFPNQGVYNQSRSYYKVTDYAGSILLENSYQGEVVIQEETASIMNLMLENVVRNGTAKSIDLKNQIDCAGKTGTTQNNYDRWYIGYTPYYIGGVWYGYEYPQALSGANQCLTIWDDIMTEIHQTRVDLKDKDDLKQFEVHANVTTAEYCKDSGKIITNACLHDPRGDRREVGYFSIGEEPTDYCSIHVPVAYDREEGGIVVSDSCPHLNVEYIGLICVERCFPTQIYVSDAQFVWRNLPNDVRVELSPSLPFFAKMLLPNEYCGISKSQTQFNRACRRHLMYSGS